MKAITILFLTYEELTQEDQIIARRDCKNKGIKKEDTYFFENGLIANTYEEKETKTWTIKGDTIDGEEKKDLTIKSEFFDFNNIQYELYRERGED